MKQFPYVRQGGCAPWKVGLVEGAGRGLFATRNIQAGGLVVYIQGHPNHRFPVLSKLLSKRTVCATTLAWATGLLLKEFLRSDTNFFQKVFWVCKLYLISTNFKKNIFKFTFRSAVKKYSKFCVRNFSVFFKLSHIVGK
jgi:hypothetical protein